MSHPPTTPPTPPRHPEHREGSHFTAGDSSSQAPQNDSAGQPHENIKTLCAQMARSIYNSPTDHAVLDEQIQILNSLFHATLAEQLNLKPGTYGHSSAQGWLDMALKIQKQCVETVRTQQASRYMASLTTKNIPAPMAPALQTVARPSRAEAGSAAKESPLPQNGQTK